MDAIVKGGKVQFPLYYIIISSAFGLMNDIPFYPSYRKCSPSIVMI
jgi:hypothetical protein